MDETGAGGRGYTVGRVADIAGVTVRTLHHYDAIGLLVPSGRTDAGYRTYDDADLSRLRRIRFYREVGMSLEAVAEVLRQPDDSADQLREQHRLLRERIDGMRRMLASIDTELERIDMGIALTPEEQHELFGTDRLGGDWADEAQRRWGDSAEWAESQRRTRGYAKDDWKTMRAEDLRINETFRALADAGVPPTDAGAIEAALAHRAHITRWFYECTPQIHRGLAGMYLQDPRFGDTYDAVRPGLAQYIAQAIIAATDADAHAS